MFIVKNFTKCNIKPYLYARYCTTKIFKLFICVEMMGLIGAGNNPMVGMSVAVAVEQSMKG